MHHQYKSLICTPKIRWASLLIFGGMTARKYVPSLKTKVKHIHLRDEDILFIIGLSFI